MLNLDANALLILTASLFILIFGALSVLRREGLSVQFAVESVALSAVLIGGSWLLGLRLSPILLLVVLYLVALRSRLLADLANLLVKRGRAAVSFRLYRLALAWWPDPPTRLMVLANRGAAELYTNQVEQSIATLTEVLKGGNGVRLAPRYEAACRYNLGFAYEKKGEDAQAVQQYNHVIDLVPGSMYAHAASAALKRRKQKEAGN